MLCARTNWQRQEIARAFKVMYGKDLLKDLKSELSGDFEDLILALLEPPALYDAKQLHKAMAGLGTTESILIEIMTSRTNQQIAEIKQAYRGLYGKDLEKELIGETSGSFQVGYPLFSQIDLSPSEAVDFPVCRWTRRGKLRRSPSCQPRRQKAVLGRREASRNRRELFQRHSCQPKLRPIAPRLRRIPKGSFLSSFPSVTVPFQVTNHSIEKAIESEFSGDIKDGMMAVIAVVRNRPAYFAQLLNNSMKVSSLLPSLSSIHLQGLGTRDNDLIRLVVSRAEYDMADIRNAFQQLYRTSLENMIKGDCSGSYKDGLIALVKGN